jgi:Mpp10 protein
LAPEEIKRKPKGDVIGAGERTITDKKRERRHKKVHQKQKFEKNPLGGKSLLDKVTKSRNVEKVS